MRGYAADDQKTTDPVKQIGIATPLATRFRGELAKLTGSAMLVLFGGVC
jgi:hypothetical protein